jgi:hypothetical protein
VLHARTPLTVTLERRADRVRISVSDQSSAPVAPRHYQPDALTGRGLGVVAAVSRSWGVEPATGGKVIWAELVVDGGSPGRPAGQPRWRPAGQPPAAAAGRRPVRFPAVPVADYLELQEHNDALFRELQLIRIRLRTQGGEAATEPPRGLLSLADRLLAEFRRQRDTWREEVARAQASGADTVDLELEVPPAAVPAARAYVELLEEADEFSRTGELLVPPPSGRVRRLRRWFVEQMAAQLRSGTAAE